jgi:hypothetical protein
VPGSEGIGGRWRGWVEKGGCGGKWGEMTQILYAYMNKRYVLKNNNFFL